MIAKQIGKVLIALFFLFCISMIPVQAETVFEDDFESGLGDWWVDNGVWEVGIPTVGPDNAYSGSNVGGTVLDGDYPGTDSRLISPSILLPAIGSGEEIHLRFFHWFNIDAQDAGWIQISEETAPGIWSSWTTLAEYRNSSGGVWTRPLVDLSGYADKKVRIGFLMDYYCCGTSSGWYVDDVSINVEHNLIDLSAGDIYFYDFESGLGDWWVDNGVWEVGIPTVGPDNAYSGSNVGGTVLDGDYPGTDSRLISPSILLPAIGSGEEIHLRFFHWFNIDAQDAGWIQISEETAPGIWSSWTTLAEYRNSSGGVWTRPLVDLSGYADKKVQIGFLMDYYCCGASSGWYIDDVEVKPPTGSCTYSITPTSDSFISSGGSDSVSVTADIDCNWTAISNDPDWIMIKSGSSGIGDGTVTYSVSENTKTISRTGTITIAGKTFTVTQNGTDMLDNVPPTIKIDYPKDGDSYNFVYFITGSSDDVFPSSGLDKIEIQVFDGSKYLGSDGEWHATENWITVTGTESWFYITDKVIWEDGATYTVTANVYDKEVNMGTSSNTFTFEKLDPAIIQAYSTLGLELSSQTILQNETIDASGKLTRLPNDGTDLSGEIINLTITAPDGTATTRTTTTYSTSGYYEFEGVTGFTQKGTYTIQASFDETVTLTESNSDPLSVLIGSSAGYAIIVEGKISSEEGLDSHNKTVNRIYDTLLARGFLDKNIYYLNYDTSQTGVDASPTVANIKTAIESWPLDKMNGSPAPLYIILHDHGKKDGLYIGDDEITPSDLDSWFNNLEKSLNSNALLEKQIIIYGACYSGSFISKLSETSTGTDGGRVIITSAASEEESYKGPLEPDGIRSGSYFLEEFFKELGRGKSIKESFVSATERTEKFTRKGGMSAKFNNKYLDSAMQHPLLDDNGDSVGSNVLSDSVGDGQAAKVLFLGTGRVYDTNSESNPAEIDDVTDTVHLDPFTSTYLMWAASIDDDEVSSAWMEIREPAHTLSETGGTNQLSTGFTRKLMTLNKSRWEKNITTFTDSGMYEIFYFVRDITTLEISPAKRSVVYKDKVGNNPPDIFDLKSPTYGSEEQTILIFEWEAATDPDGDDITYNLLIATDKAFKDIVYEKEEITTTATYVDDEAGLSDLTTYYWKVQAVDAYGLMTDSTQKWPFYTNNTNFGTGFIIGIVYDDSTFEPITGVEIRTDLGGTGKSIAGGYYILEVSAGTHKVTGMYGDGYEIASFTGIDVSFGKTTKLNIPMSGSVAGTDPTPDIKANGSGNSITIGTSDTLSISIGIDANGSLGVECDWWIVVSTPSGWQYYDLSLGDYTPGLMPSLQGVSLVDFGSNVIFNTSGLGAGTYTYYFAVDLGGGQLFYDSVVVTVTAIDPSPQITANGSGGTVNINEGDPLSIAISLSSGSFSGVSADWWIIVSTPSGEWEHYDFSLGDYTPGLMSSLPGFSLVDFGSNVIFNTSGLGAGTYTYYFAVDLGGGQVFFKSVVVNISL